jgi:hypothetical protein
MRISILGLALLLAMGGMSCAGKGGSNGGGAAPVPAAGLTAGGQTGAAPAVAAALSIPKDAQWTIYCTAISGPNHAARAQALKDQLARGTRLHDWYVVQADVQSTLYYGFYADEKDSRARQDRTAIAELVAQNGERMFSQPCLVPLELADPAAPPEWNLANVTDKEYTLEIAGYRDDARRKEVAVEAVRELRAQGVEAYYYHGPTASVVCVGAWPASAVEEPTDVRARNPDELVVVAPPGVKMPEIEPGRSVNIVRPQAKLNDPSIEAAIKRFPKHLTNGLEVTRKVTDAVTQQVTAVTERSVLIHIPRGQTFARRPTWPGSGPGPAAPAADGSAGMAREAMQAPSPAARPRPQQGGKLRSLED